MTGILRYSMHSRLNNKRFHVCTDICAKKLYTGISTDRKTCAIILCPLSWSPSSLLWSLLPVATHQSHSASPYTFSSLFSIVSHSQCTYTGGVIALSCREQGHSRGRTNAQNRMYGVLSVKRSRRGVGVGGISITIIILPHFKRCLSDRLL